MIEPIYQTRRWGRRRLTEMLTLPLSDDGLVGEAWLSAECFKTRLLDSYWNIFPRDCLINNIGKLIQIVQNLKEEASETTYRF